MQSFLKLLKLASVLLGLLAIVLAVDYLWDGGYWERYKSIYDPKLQAFRCLDENGDIDDGIGPPCLVMTPRGRNAVERRIRKCKEMSPKPEDCAAEAYEWLWSKRPKQSL